VMYSRSLFVVFVLLGTHAWAATNRNVLLLISDNQNKDDCGCYGNNVVQTPNIDQLARDGIRFLDAFATTASCGPSRAVIYSGLQTHTNGQYGHGHGIHTYALSSKVKTIYALLGAAGYQTALLGKQHTTHPSSYPFTFNRKVSGRDVTRIASIAKEFITQAGDEPFFLTIGYQDPHPTSIPRPGWGVVRKDDAVPIVQYDPADVIVPRYLPDRPEVREGIAGYYQEISRLDHGIGQVLEVLHESGRADETLVIFTSDHGSSEPGAMGNHYEPGIQIPMVVRHPDGIGKGTTNKALVTLADLTPTILDWTQTKGPGYPLHGRSFLPVLNDPEPKGWDEVLLSHVCHEVTMYYPMRTIRNRRYKLIWNVDWRSEYPLPIDTLRRATWTETVRRGDPTIGPRSVKKFLYRDQIELYDLQRDPDEIFNLADDPKHESVRRDLSQRLTSWLQDTDDQWLVRHRLPLPGEPESISSRQANVDDQTGYRSIFNGKNLDGWELRRGDRGGYKVQDSSLVCPADGGGFLFTEEQFGDFSFCFDFRLEQGANNGIAIRSPMVDAKPAYEGMEIQILDNRGYPKELKPTQYHGALYDVAPARRGALKPAGQWNRQEIRCEGRRVTVTVNDIPVLDVNLDAIRDQNVLKKHPGLLRKAGHIGLLGHGSRVEFRNLRVKELIVVDRSAISTF
jgi:N-sulfoglucosamine sulfohydrolase